VVEWCSIICCENRDDHGDEVAKFSECQREQISGLSVQPRSVS